MDRNSFAGIVTWYDSLWQADKRRDFTDLIEQKLREARDKPQFAGLMHVLHFELVRQERFREAIALLQTQIKADPSDVHSQIQLAQDFLYYLRDVASAAHQAQVAHNVAVEHGRLVRHALGVRARVAKATNDYPLLAECMEQILAVPASGPFDSLIETDFLSDLPDHALPEGLAVRYRHAAGKDRRTL